MAGFSSGERQRRKIIGIPLQSDLSEFGCVLTGPVQRTILDPAVSGKSTLFQVSRIQEIFMRTMKVLFTLIVLTLSCLTDTHAETGHKPIREPDIHFVATPHNVVEIMLRLADIKRDDTVYDLGCGDGRILIAAAKKAGCRAVGFEIDPEMVEESIDNVSKAKLESLVTIKEADIFTIDLSEASVVTLFLLPELNLKLLPQLQKMKPGSRIVSYEFDMPGYEPEVTATINRYHKVYLWTIPLQKIHYEETVK